MSIINRRGSKQLPCGAPSVTIVSEQDNPTDERIGWRFVRYDFKRGEKDRGSKGEREKGGKGSLPNHMH